MIQKIIPMPVTPSSYPFASAERYCRISERGYEETEYAMHGTANVYRTGEDGKPEVSFADAPYVNRFVVRAPKDPSRCSGNLVVEIINPTSFMEIDRMWILARDEFMRRGDIYVGITSKPNTIAKMVAFDAERYGILSWKNPTPDVPFPFTAEDMKKKGTILDQQISYEPGLFWDMLTDLAWKLRSQDADNPLRTFPRDVVCLTGWSQSGCYLTRYLRDFAYAPASMRGGDVFDGYLAAGPVHSFVIPLSQYEAARPTTLFETRVDYCRHPYMEVQTESENGQFDGFRTARPDSDDPEKLYRVYEVTGASHDTMASYVDYYQKDADLVRINHLPKYVGKHDRANDYPSDFLFNAAYRNLFRWVREGAAPATIARIPVDRFGLNRKDVFGNTFGGLRTCLLDVPTARYMSTSNIESGANAIFPNSDKDLLFGYEEAFPAEMLKWLYGTLEAYREKCVASTKEHVTAGMLCPEDADAVVEMAVRFAAERGLA